MKALQKFQAVVDYGGHQNTVEMIKFEPRRIEGPQESGFVLDLHTVRSTELKYRGDEGAVGPLIEAAGSFIESWDVKFEAIVPVPPTRSYRKFQPVLRLASVLGARLRKPVLRNAVRKVKQTTEMKNVTDPEERRRLLQNAFEADARVIARKRLLLVDDLYRSGATMAHLAEALASAGAAAVYAFAFTETRSRL